MDYYVTLTMKQAIPGKYGAWTKLTREQCQRTAWIFRDRLTKRLLSTRKYKRGVRINVQTFIESGFQTSLYSISDVKGVYQKDMIVKAQRTHIHIAIKCPDNVSEDEFRAAVDHTISSLDWTRRIFDIRRIIDQSVLESGTVSVLGYSLKEGSDAFCPEASYLPTM